MLQLGFNEEIARRAIAQISSSPQLKQGILTEYNKEQDPSKKATAAVLRLRSGALSVLQRKCGTELNGLFAGASTGTVYRFYEIMKADETRTVEQNKFIAEMVFGAAQYVNEVGVNESKKKIASFGFDFMKIYQEGRGNPELLQPEYSDMWKAQGEFYENNPNQLGGFFTQTIVKYHWYAKYWYDRMVSDDSLSDDNKDDINYYLAYYAGRITHGNPQLNQIVGFAP